MKILVTGANGFIGHHLCSHLVAQGHTVTAAVRRQGAAPAGTSEVLIADMEQDSHWAGILAGHDAVVHLAARVHVMRDRSGDPLADFRRVNVEGTATLARSAIDQGVGRFVFLSSIKVYGEGTRESRYSASSMTLPVDPYGISKLEAEKAIREIADGTGMSVVVIRTPLVYGPGVGGNFERILKLAHSKLPLPLAGVRNHRSMVSVWNLVRLLESAMIEVRAAGATMVAGDEISPSTPQLLRTLRKAMGLPARLFWLPVSLLRVAGTLTGQSSTVDRLVNSLEVEVGSDTDEWTWQPTLDFETSIERTVGWFKSQSTSAEQDAVAR